MPQAGELLSPPVTAGYLELMVAYHAWAGQRLLEQAARLAAADLASESPSHGSVFRTLRHMLDVSWSWRRAAEGLPDGGLLWEVEPLEDLSAVRAYWAAEDERLLAFVRSLTADDLERDVTPPWKQRPFTIWQVVLHIVFHGADHANEVGWQLTRLGQSPGELGFMRYIDSHRPGSA
jgi:uncharacterized damage-inducible protein DinB